MQQVKDLTPAGRRKVARQVRAYNQTFSLAMRQLPRDEWPDESFCLTQDRPVLEVWRSAKHIAIVYGEENGIERISVCRTMFDEYTGEWLDGISWDDLQWVKHELGRGERWAVEVYPADYDIVHVANMRHLWVLLEAPPFAWRKAT